MLSGGNQTDGNSLERFPTPYQYSRLPLTPQLLFFVFCSPAFSPDFSEPPSPWSGGGGGGEADGENLSYNQRNIKKWEKDEPLGNQATISPVLYANVNYPDLKKDFPG